MALNTPGLTQALVAIFSTPSPVAAEVASKLANAYTAYAQTGAFGVSLPVITPASTAALYGPLFAAIATPLAGTPVNFGLAWAAGVAAFWAPALVSVVGASGAGVAIPPPGAAALGSSIPLIVAVPLPSSAAAAAAIAASVDVATRTTTALLTIPSFPPVLWPLL